MKKVFRFSGILAVILLSVGMVACSFGNNKVDDETTHIHSFAKTWSFDGVYHWHSATCDHPEERLEKAEHTWDSGTITKFPEGNAYGEKLFSCTVCKYSKKETIYPVKNITATTDKIFYDKDEALDKKAIKLTVFYTNGLREEVTDFEIEGFDSSVEGSEFEVTIKYKENENSLLTTKLTLYTFLEMSVSKFNEELREVKSLEFITAKPEKPGIIDYTESSINIFGVKLIVTGDEKIQFPNGLTSADLTGLDTSNITDMSEMFSNFSRLTYLNLSNFKTFKVTNMSKMFEYCRLTELDISSFDTSNVTDMSEMFSGSYMKKINLSGLKTNSLVNMNSMFADSEVIELDLSSFDTSNVTDMSYLFHKSHLVELNLSNFNISKVTNMKHTFYGCLHLKTLDVSNFDTSNVTNMNGMFNNCYKIKELDLSNFTIVSECDVSNMFGIERDSSLTVYYNKDKWHPVNGADLMYDEEENITFVNK